MEEVQGIAKDPLVLDEGWVSQSWTAGRAIRTKTFWLLGISFFLANLVTQTVFTHQVAFFVDRGLEALLASYLVGIVGIVSIGGKILWGHYRQNREGGHLYDGDRLLHPWNARAPFVQFISHIEPPLCLCHLLRYGICCSGDAPSPYYSGFF